MADITYQYSTLKLGLVSSLLSVRRGVCLPNSLVGKLEEYNGLEGWEHFTDHSQVIYYLKEIANLSLILPDLFCLISRALLGRGLVGGGGGGLGDTKSLEITSHNSMDTTYDEARHVLCDLCIFSSFTCLVTSCNKRRLLLGFHFLLGFVASDEG